MKVMVRFLVNYRELVGCSEKSLDLPEDATIGSLLDELFRSYPRLSAHRDEVIISVNKKQARGRQKLQEGDEVVLLPPSVGG